MNDKDFYYNNKGQMTVEFNHDTLVLVRSVCKKYYNGHKDCAGCGSKNLFRRLQTVELAKVNGNQKKLVTLSDFKEIEKRNSE